MEAYTQLRVASKVRTIVVREINLAQNGREKIMKIILDSASSPWYANKALQAAEAVREFFMTALRPEGRAVELEYKGRDLEWEDLHYKEFNEEEFFRENDREELFLEAVGKMAEEVGAYFGKVGEVYKVSIKDTEMVVSPKQYFGDHNIIAVVKGGLEPVLSHHIATSIACYEREDWAEEGVTELLHLAEGEEQEIVPQTFFRRCDKKTFLENASGSGASFADALRSVGVGMPPDAVKYVLKLISFARDGGGDSVANDVITITAGGKLGKTELLNWEGVSPAYDYRLWSVDGGSPVVVAMDYDGYNNMWQELSYPLLPSPLWSEEDIKAVQREFGDVVRKLTTTVTWVTGHDWLSTRECRQTVKGMTVREVLRHAVAVRVGDNTATVGGEVKIRRRGRYDLNELFPEVKKALRSAGDSRPFVEKPPVLLVK